MTSLLALLLAPSLALAQDDGGAGLFTEARQLPLVSRSMVVDVSSTEARVHLVQVFSNPGADVGQADYRLWLPEGASVQGFGFWNDDRLLQAKLQAADDAEAKHHAAAAAGRDTALLKQDHGLTTFSVYPVPAGSLKQIEVDLVLPVVREAGRSHVVLPVDRFLGQAGVETSAVIRVTPESPIASWSVEGAKPVVLSETVDGLRMALSSASTVDVSWHEDGPPLRMTAEAVVVDEGVAVAVQVALNDAGPARSGWERVEVIVDGSASVRRRGKALGELVRRLRTMSPVPVGFHAVAGGGRVSLDPSLSASDTITRLRDGSAGHVASWTDLEAASDELGCSDTVRCVVVTDAQVDDLEAAGQGRVPTLFLADPHEKDFFAAELPESAMVWGSADGPRRMHALADRLVRPTLDYALPMLDGKVLAVEDSTERRVAEGGLARHFALMDTAGETVRLHGEVDGVGVDLASPLLLVDSTSPRGQDLRRGFYTARLTKMMRQWKGARTEQLKAEITALSLRENIPTAFTSLQVDDPELSLASIKPGDPILTVHPEPGLTDVVAWYPFGETRKLVRDAETGDFSDRFLVPRFWPERAYRVEVVKRFSDGGTRSEHVWYVLDEAAPDARVSVDAGSGQMVVDTGAGTPDVSRVRVETADGVVELPEPAEGDTAWVVDTSLLGDTFTVVVRDRAGNRSVFPCSLVDGALVVDAGPATTPSGPELAVASDRVVTMAGQGLGAQLTWTGGRLEVEVDGRTWTATLPMDSLVPTAVQVEGDDLWLGTRAGELVRIDGTGGVTRIDLEVAEHPITGLARLADGGLLVGVLGEGLVEVDAAGTVRESGLDVGSQFVTGVVAAPNGDVMVGTAYNGLWRVVRSGDSRRRALRSRVDGDLVTGLSVDDDGVVVHRAAGALRRLGRDRFSPVSDANGLRDGSPDLMGAARVGERTLVAGFDRGLLVMAEDGSLTEIPLSLGGPSTRRVNAVAAWEGMVWIATEGGLFAADTSLHNTWAVLPGATHGIATSPDGLAAATSDGLHAIDLDGQVRRVDTAPDFAGGWMSVAFHGGEIWAGNMEGVARFDGDGDKDGAAWLGAAEGFTVNWGTALLSDGDRLLVGTYADGVWAVDAGGAALLGGLGGQWVPPNALARVGGELWVGGLGMDPVVVGADGTPRRVETPARDVNGFAEGTDGEVVLFTSDGLATVRLAPVAAR
jgi:hypothetical protein